MKWDKEFLDLLCDPVTGEILTLSDEAHLISPGKNNSYSVKNGIARLLVKKQPANNEFNYAEHYEKDAQVFDYGNEFDAPVEISEVSRLRQRILSTIPTNAKLILDVGCGGA